MVYGINILRVITLLVPTFLRQPKQLAWLGALAFPWVILHGQFMQYRTQALRQIQTTPQVWALEKLLNDAYDYVQRRIYISDGVYSSTICFFEKESNRPVRFYEDQPVYFSENHQADSSVDFVVHLPQRLLLSEGELAQFKGVIRQYALPDKTFEIEKI